MIPLTRLGHTDPFFLNPDLIERIDAHVDTVIRLTNGIEYVVAEPADQIVDRIVEFRLRTHGAGPVIARGEVDERFGSERHPSERTPSDRAVAERPPATVVELPSNREVPR